MALIDGTNLKGSITGMTDAELVHACEDQFTGVSAWAHWTSEVYSFGKCLRYWTKYPSIFPLFVYSDHGVGLETHLFPHDLENQAKVHFTWNSVKEQRYKGSADKKVIQIIHPWIAYRRSKGITRTTTPGGTLVFFSHGTTAVKWEGHDTEDYFEQLRKLPDKFQPVVLCLHMHDIKAGLHKELRCQGFPIVTAGNTLSIHFVDRFYDLVKDYAYATSQTWGSQVAYCVELGVPYFFLGERPELINIADKNLPTGVVPQYWDSYHEEYVKKAEALFRLPVDSVTGEQREFIESLLGVDSRITRWQVSWILWREFFRNWRQWRAIFTPLLFRFLNKLGRIPMISRLLDLSLRKIIRRVRRMVQQDAMPVRVPVIAKASVIELLGEEQYSAISQLDRYTAGELEFQGYTLRFTDNGALFGMLDEIFVRENYKFECATQSPTIIDCGANIGLSVLYFKSQYPDAVIHAFEPDPGAYEKLVANIEANGFKDVFTHQAAVWIEDGELVFETDGSWGGHIGDGADSAGVTVKAHKLDGLLGKKVDFLKMDIEGAESDVIMHAKELIAKNVDKLFFEWHSLSGQPQRLGEILAFFEKQGFRYHIKEASIKQTPFIYKPTSRMDSQLDVFLWK